ncbi:hypothetical protein BDN72DRAFT_177043 [Pluteus cervinus]|uniref:Uncharacterized protein n=1 Tax=Pluteus cervinus TaxID=181527 RepID=A0ACD3AJF2_9AGAR|nr:hypothetical protein BDN72DRAFT_177043 [Pluteus cervinus]
MVVPCARFSGRYIAEVSATALVTQPVNSAQPRDLPNLTLGFALSSPTSFLSFCCPPLSQATPPPSLYSSRLSGCTKILEKRENSRRF